MFVNLPCCLFILFYFIYLFTCGFVCNGLENIDNSPCGWWKVYKLFQVTFLQYLCMQRDEVNLCINCEEKCCWHFNVFTSWAFPAFILLSSGVLCMKYFKVLHILVHISLSAKCIIGRNCWNDISRNTTACKNWGNLKNEMSHVAIKMMFFYVKKKKSTMWCHVVIKQRS